MTAAAALLSLLLEAREAEARWALPPALLVAVVIAESNGRRLVFRERGGHCSVGPAGVLVRGCERERLRRLLVLSTNLDEAGRIAARGRLLCEKHPRWRCCRTHWIGAFNSGSPRYASRVLRIWRRLLRRGLVMVGATVPTGKVSAGPRPLS